MTSFFLSLIRELMSLLLTMPATKGKIVSGTVVLESTPRDKVLERARRAGLLLLCLLLSSCGQTEIVVSRLFPIEDWPGGFPMLAEGSARVMLQDGTVGTLKDAGGLLLVHPADVKALISAAKPGNR